MEIANSKLYNQKVKDQRVRGIFTGGMLASDYQNSNRLSVL